MRALLLSPIFIAISALLGVALCHTTSLDPHLRELALAAGVCLAAGEVAAVPLMIYRGLMHPAQAALLATVAHLLIATFATGGVILLAHPPVAFVYWLFVFYFVTLLAVCAAAIRVVRSAPVETPTSTSGPAH
jgi:O-antigen/teichoic acid export membrane protein